MYWTNEQYSKNIATLKQLVAEGKKITGVDSNFSGDKYNHCSHGLCSEAFENDSTPYKQQHHICPLDMRENPGPSGCFHDCLFFKGHRKSTSIYLYKNVLDNTKDQYDKRRNGKTICNR